MRNGADASTGSSAASGAISGHYTTRRGRGLAYDYDAFWSLSGDRILWSAKVCRNGAPTDQPVGIVRMIEGAPPELAVRKLVEFSIESLGRDAKPERNRQLA